MRKVIIASGFVSLSLMSISVLASSTAPGMGYYVYEANGAGTYQSQSNDFNGAYLGAALTVNPQRAKFSYPGIESYSAGKTDLNGGLFAGYGWTVSKAYLGLELDGRYNFSGATYAVSNSAFSMDGAKETWATGLSGLFGGVISDSALLYLLGGVQYAHFKFSPASNTTSVSKSKLGWHAGLGVNLQMTQHWNFDLRYQYENYSPFQISTAAPKITVTNNLVTMGVSYHFS